MLEKGQHSTDSVVPSWAENETARERLRGTQTVETRMVRGTERKTWGGTPSVWGVQCILFVPVGHAVKTCLLMWHTGRGRGRVRSVKS